MISPLVFLIILFSLVIALTLYFQNWRHPAGFANPAKQIAGFRGCPSGC